LRAASLRLLPRSLLPFISPKPIPVPVLGADTVSTQVSPLYTFIYFILYSSWLNTSTNRRHVFACFRTPQLASARARELRFSPKG
jgi:hypothetical protein